MFFAKLLPREDNFFAMFNQHADRIVEAARAFSLLVANYNDVGLRDKYTGEVDAAERAADRVTHEVNKALHKTFITPIDREQIHSLINTMDDVVDGVVKKLLYRHPHVFGSAHEDSPESVLISWDQLKRAEKGQATTGEAMEAVARSLPGLWRAEKLQKKAADAGFDWPDISGALSKLEEEVRELRQAVETGRGVEEELGDVLFAAVKVGRFAGIDPEEAVAGTCEKFIHRFRAVEDGAREQGRTLEDMPLEEMTRLWNQAK